MARPDWSGVLALAARTPTEVCGIVYDGEVHVLENSSDTPEHDFAIKPEVLRSFFVGRDLALWQGVWHSHPNGDPEPSKNDIAWHPIGKKMHILAGGEVHTYG